jgi:hypothetical protein
MPQFFEVTGNNTCFQYGSFNITTRNIVSGSIFLTLGIVNLLGHGLLLSIILYNWTAVFKNDFVYKLIINMNVFCCLNTIVHFIITVPCTFTGCLFYSEDTKKVLVTIWRTLEYGFFWNLFFIAIDRFFSFYCQDFSRFFRKVSWTGFLTYSVIDFSLMLSFYYGS